MALDHAQAEPGEEAQRLQSFAQALLIRIQNAGHPRPPSICLPLEGLDLIGTKCRRHLRRETDRTSRTARRHLGAEVVVPEIAVGERQEYRLRVARRRRILAVPQHLQPPRQCLDNLGDSGDQADAVRHAFHACGLRIGEGEQQRLYFIVEQHAEPLAELFGQGGGQPVGAGTLNHRRSRACPFGNRNDARGPYGGLSPRA